MNEIKELSDALENAGAYGLLTIEDGVSFRTPGEDCRRTAVLVDIPRLPGETMLLVGNMAWMTISDLAEIVETRVNYWSGRALTRRTA